MPIIYENVDFVTKQPVLLVFTNVSEEPITSIFGIEESQDGAVDSVIQMEDGQLEWRENEEG
jgi:hypothetical protein